MVKSNRFQQMEIKSNQIEETQIERNEETQISNQAGYEDYLDALGYLNGRPGISEQSFGKLKTLTRNIQNNTDLSYCT